jgi:hypothetical protein
LLAYIATGASVIGGFYHYGNLLLRDATGHATSAVFLALLVTAISIWIAWRDVKISARVSVPLPRRSPMPPSTYASHVPFPARAQTSGMVATGVVVGAMVEMDCAKVSIGERTSRRNPYVELWGCICDASAIPPRLVS